MLSAKTKKTVGKLITYAVLVTGSLFCIVPLVWMVRSSLMTPVEIFMVPVKWVPDKLMWSNYKKVFEVLPFFTYYRNSLFIAALVVAGSMLTSSICAYGLARIKWKGRNVVFACIMASMMLPFAVTLIPTFLMWRAIGFTNSFVPLVAPAWFGGGAFYIFLLRQFYMTIPKDFDEAGYLDGANHF